LGNSGELIPVERREEVFTAEDAEGAEIRTEGKRERIEIGRPSAMDRGGGRHDDVACSRMSDRGSIASLVFSALSLRPLRGEMSAE
jgi:hypothetical protein